MTNSTELRGVAAGVAALSVCDSLAARLGRSQDHGCEGGRWDHHRRRQRKVSPEQARRTKTRPSTLRSSQSWIGSLPAAIRSGAPELRHDTDQPVARLDCRAERCSTPPALGKGRTPRLRIRAGRSARRRATRPISAIVLPFAPDLRMRDATSWRILASMGPSGLSSSCPCRGRN